MALLQASGSTVVPGRLFKDPTDMTGNTGTFLGVTSFVAWDEGQVRRLVGAHEFGGEVTEAIMSGRFPILIAVFQEVTDALNEATDPNASGSKRKHPGTNRAGRALAQDAITVAWIPDQSDHPAILFRKAMVEPDEGPSLAFSLGLPSTYSAVFIPVRDADNSDEMFEVDLASNITV